MRLRSICELIEGTADAAFATDSHGSIVALNKAAEGLFGVDAQNAVGQFCHLIVNGVDECGNICSENCSIKQAAGKNHPIHHFDLKVDTQNGRQWCNMSVIIAQENNSKAPYTIHILRPVDVRKRLELAVRDFLVTEVSLPKEKAAALVRTTKSGVRETELTAREREILKLMGTGKSSSAIAAALHISRNTVDNHVQHILKKLNVHSRLEAVRKAELAGLI
ncbi:MAG: two component transcriptional regulator, LuxR family [Acidobacteria bacterium OLB17]|nr:MAG: two component transcriptional regulator, LuxR family [Acidobacteria bacterium OLB17]MCZ2392186.1 LuxR C-terminal-related transcriptional regulator [Acidobacteriota bacterium]